MWQFGSTARGYGLEIQNTEDISVHLSCVARGVGKADPDKPSYFSYS